MLHSWNVSVKRAISIQKELSNRIILNGHYNDKNINKIAASDIAYSKKGNKIWAVVIVFSYPGLNLLEIKYVAGKVSFPYIPGLLTFREGPALLSVFKKIKNKPDVILFDGQGIAHPRRMGLATHMGILLNKPTIGCAKSCLWGKFNKVPKIKGTYSLIKDKNRPIGAVVCMKDKTKPVFVSPGFKIDLKTSINIILKCSGKFRLPEPLRHAHIIANKLKN